MRVDLVVDEALEVALQFLVFVGKFHRRLRKSRKGVRPLCDLRKPSVIQKGV
jgi:hypothetical protein